MTIFLTTHRLEEANSLCHRIAIIDHGRLAATDTPANLRAIMRQVQSVEVQIEGVGADDIKALGSAAGVTRLVRQGQMLRLYTSDPVSTIRAILEYADRNGRTVNSLAAGGPSLEDVFLYLTGGAAAIGGETPASQMANAAGNGRSK